MGHQYFALTAWDHPRQNPVALVRVDGATEEMFVPPFHWVRPDPVYREWFVNVPISAAEADALITRAGPRIDIQDRDPRSNSRRSHASEGYGDQHLYFAVVTEEHPFDDPLTIVREDLTRAREVVSYTRHLVWGEEPVEGGLVRITQEDAARFREVLARRVFGDADVRHFAVTNHLYPDVADPHVLIRELVGENGQHRYETLDENRRWVETSRRHHCGEPVTGAALDHLLTSWSPRPRTAELRFFVFTDGNGDPLRLARVESDEDGHLKEKTFVGEHWNDVACAFDQEGEPAEVDEARAGELEEAVTRLNSAPAGVRYRYWVAINRKVPGWEFLDYVVRTWGGADGTRNSEYRNGAGTTWFRADRHGLVHLVKGFEAATEAEVEELRRSPHKNLSS
jgi:hypothetical protein